MTVRLPVPGSDDGTWGDISQAVGLSFNSGGSGGYYRNSTSGSTAIDPYSAETFDFALSGNTTLKNPSLTGTNTTGTFLYSGQKLRFIIRQGSAAHTVTWGAAYNVVSPPSVSANSISTLEFIYDGSVWQQL